MSPVHIKPERRQADYLIPFMFTVLFFVRHEYLTAFPSFNDSVLLLALAAHPTGQTDLVAEVAL